MTAEELFLAIGQVESSRLERSERTVHGSSWENIQEDQKMNRTKPSLRRILRNTLIAALIASSLSVTAYAVGAYVIYESPEELLTILFGDRTGYDHGEAEYIPDPEGGSIYHPEFDRVAADPTVVQEDIAPYVSPVGQSIGYHGMVLTVDSFLYDSATRCGVVTYTLENGPEYYLQYDGRVDYMGRGHPASFNQYGYHYIIQDKTTDDLLAAAYYFRYDAIQEEEFFVTINDSPTLEERKAVYDQCSEQVRAAYTREEAIAKTRERLGADYEAYLEDYRGYYEDYEAEAAYLMLRDMAVVEYYENNPEAQCQEKISFDCAESRELKHRTFGEGSVTVSPISIQVDIAPMTFLHREDYPLDSSLIDGVAVQFADGTEYVVFEGDVINTLFALNTTADGTMQSDYTKLVMMFNRIVDLDQVTGVRVNDQILKID